MPHESTTHALGKAVYSTLCLSKGLGAGAAPNCTVKTNTDLFSLVGKTMVNSAEWNQLGIFCLLLFLLLCKCSCSYASFSCGILCDIQYKSEQTLLFLIWWMMENIEITDLFQDVSFFPFWILCRRAGFCSPQCMLTEPLFYRICTFTTCVWVDITGIPFWLQSAWDFPHVTIVTRQESIRFSNRTSLLYKLFRYNKDYTKFKFFKV